ncbi:HdeD family acid-resistance protein [Bradyrhizobium sp.]|uniref:HdeD family acid-resistance protein n=1 Tax=Bradyrhizobium sp. TaxID=376 RepID=UPI003C4D18CB
MFGIMSKKGKEFSSLDEAEMLIEGAEHAARSHWLILLVEGVALVGFGALALFIAPLMSLGTVTALGWCLLLGGIAAMIAYFPYRAARISYLLFLAAFAVIAGLALLVKPWSGAISLTVILIICLALLGAAKLTFPLERSRYLSGYRGWIQASSVVDLVLAGLMFADLPETALWAPGILLGANMILGGIALVVIALLERRKLVANHADRHSVGV